MAEFIELHKKSLVDEKTFAVLQNVNNISEICETPRRAALISLRNNPVAGYYDRFETVETYEQIKQLLSECGSIAAADVAPVVRCKEIAMDKKAKIEHWASSEESGGKRANIRASEYFSDWFIGYGKDESCQFEGTWWDMICLARNILSSPNTKQCAPEFYHPEFRNDNYCGEEKPYEIIN